MDWLHRLLYFLYRNNVYVRLGSSHYKTAMSNGRITKLYHHEHSQTMHLNLSKFSKNDPDRLCSEASPSFLDVYILGKLMDFLVISYSAFSKIASKWSLKPAWVFKHSIRDKLKFFNTSVKYCR